MIIDVATISLSVVGCWELARDKVSRRRHGRRGSFKRAWLFLLIAVVARFLLGGSGGLEGLVIVLRDLGLGLVASSYYLVVRKTPAKRWFFAGMVLFGLWTATHLLEPFTARSELLVELGPDDQIAEVAPILDHFDADFERAFPNVTLEEDPDLAQYYLVQGPKGRIIELMEALRNDRENVDSVEWNERIHLVPTLPGQTVSVRDPTAVSNDPHLTSQWGLRQIHGHEALTALKHLRPTRIATVAIVDTGVDSGHEDLGAVFRTSPGDTDGHGHGTHCAGIAAAATNNGLGIASLNWEGHFIRIASYRALSSEGWGTVESIAQAIIDAAEDGADVISLSLGGYHPQPPKAQVDAIEYALRLGCIVVAAAGNDGEDARLHAPANVPGVIAVAAVDANGRRASFSNRTHTLQRPISAPGVDILSLAPHSEYVALSGTSMATPLVAGLVGLMRALDPDLDPAEAYRILEQTGTRLDASQEIGPVIDAQAAIDELLIAMQTARFAEHR